MPAATAADLLRVTLVVAATALAVLERDFLGCDPPAWSAPVIDSAPAFVATAEPALASDAATFAFFLGGIVSLGRPGKNKAIQV